MSSFLDEVAARTPAPGGGAQAYTAVLSSRGEARREAVRRATEVPREIAETAAQVAALAHTLVTHGNPRLVGDARVAELLATTAGEAA